MLVHAVANGETDCLSVWRSVDHADYCADSSPDGFSDGVANYRANNGTDSDAHSIPICVAHCDTHIVSNRVP